MLENSLTDPASAAGIVPNTILPSDPPALAFAVEFCGESAIAPELYRVAVQVRDELEIDPFTHEAEGWPLHEALGWKPPSRDYQTRKPHRFGAGAFLLQETGDIWQIKPQNPRPNPEKPGRFVKYETPVGSGSRAYFPPINRETFEAICQRHGLDFEATRLEVKAAKGFWRWVASRRDLPVIVTEGGKKSLCLLSHGFIAIALTGVNGGYRSTDSEGNKLLEPTLIADLAPFVSRGRRVTLAFDNDLKPETRRKVLGATSKFGWLLARSGCQVNIARWNTVEFFYHDAPKGVDDLIANHGVSAWEQALAGAKSLRSLGLIRQLDNPIWPYTPNERITRPDLSEYREWLNIPETGAIALLSSKGTGKTKLIAQLIAGWERAIAPGHRQSLQQGLGKRLGLDYLGDCDRFKGSMINADGEPTKRLSLCWDSLLAINLADYPPGSYVLVLDEVDQGLRHLILGGTCGKDGRRPALVAKAETLIKGAGLVILASADLTAIELDFIASIRNEQPWILQNDYQSGAYICDFATGLPKVPGSTGVARAAVLTELIKRLGRGDRCWVATDTLRAAKVIEQIALGLGIPAAKTLTYSSETSSEPQQQQFADDPDKFIAATGTKLVIATPALTSGVSIETSRFDAVFGFFEGQSSAPWDCTQALGRVREPAPRYVFAAHWGKGHSLTDGNNRLAVMGDLSFRAMLGVAEGRSAVGELLDETSPAANYAACAIASQNAAMCDFGAQVQLRLEADGCKLVDYPVMELRATRAKDLKTLAKDPNAPVETADLLRAEQLWNGAIETVRQQAAIAIAQAPAIGRDELDRLEALKKKNKLPLADRLKLDRHTLCNFYALEPQQLTAKTVLQDRRGAYQSEIKRLENLIFEGIAFKRDSDRLKQLTYWGKPVLAHDLPGNRGFLGGALCLGLDTMAAAAIEAESGWTNETDWVIEFARKTLEDPEFTKTALGFTVRPSMTPAQIVGMALRSIGLATKAERSGSGDRKRVYWLDQKALQLVRSILLRREKNNNAQRRPHLLTGLVLEGGMAGTLQDLIDEIDNELDREQNAPVTPLEAARVSERAAA